MSDETRKPQPNDEPEVFVPATDPNEVYDDDPQDGEPVADSAPNRQDVIAAHDASAAPSAASEKSEEPTRSEEPKEDSPAKEHKEEQSPLVRKLRREFIISSMLAVGLVVIALVAFVDIASWRQGVDEADSQLQTLAETGGSFEDLIHAREFGSGPFGPGGPADFDGGELPAPPSERHGTNVVGSEGESVETPGTPGVPDEAVPHRGDFEAGRDRGFFGIDNLQDVRGMTDETPYQMRFFSVTLDADGSLLDVDLARVVSVDESGAEELARSVTGTAGTKGSIQNYRYLVIADEDSGEGALKYLFLDRSSDLIKLRSLVLASIGVAAAGLVAVFILVVIFSRHVVEPIAESYKRQRRFITDASHDLKTPVAIIGSDVDVIELTDGPSEWTQSIRNQVTRLTNLTDKLVMLSSMDEGSDAVTKVDFNLEATIEGTVREYAAHAKMAGKTIVSDIEPRLTLHGDAVLIEQALNLLLDNAIKYSSDGAQIKVSARHERGKVAIRVANPVDSIAAGDHDELFERFTRADSSRTSSTGGNGIGLAVVKAIAEAHGGSASAKSKDSKSIEFTVRV